MRVSFSRLLICVFLGAQWAMAEPSAPRRIVTLAPSLGELVADLLDDEPGRLVGVSDYSDYPPSLLKLPSVGGYDHVNLERVVALKPDLILATEDGNSKDQVEHLRELGLRVSVVKTGSLVEVYDSIRTIGVALGRGLRAQTIIDQLTRGVARLRERNHNRSLPTPRVLLQLGADPVIAVGAGTFLNEALQIIGADNILSDSKEHYPRPALEELLRRGPTSIIILALGKDRKQFDQMALAWNRFPNLPAVRLKRVKVLKADELLRPTPRLLEGLSRLEKVVHGDE